MGYAAAGLAIIEAGTQMSKGSPRVAAPPVMPDQTSVQQSQQLAEAKDAALRFGRQATILTGTGPSSTGAGGAGGLGTSQRLGP